MRDVLINRMIVFIAIITFSMWFIASIEKSIYWQGGIFDSAIVGAMLMFYLAWCRVQYWEVKHDFLDVIIGSIGGGLVVYWIGFRFETMQWLNASKVLFGITLSIGLFGLIIEIFSKINQIPREKVSTPTPQEV